MKKVNTTVNLQGNPVEPSSCKKCNVSFQGDPIPDNIKEHYSSTHWNRVIGIEDPEIYDGVIKWLCPDCGFTWDRFPFKMEKK